MSSEMIKRRPRHEVVMVVLHPLAHACVRPLARWGVDPLAVVAFHSLLGVVAAALMAFAGPPGDLAPFVASDVAAGTEAGGGSTPSALWPAWIAAALLLVAKAVLDNVDGALARATRRVTQMGRYFDTGMDTVLGVLLFAALAVHAPLVWVIVAYVTSVWILSLDFNMERMYRELRAVDEAPMRDVPVGAPDALFRPFAWLYRHYLAPQDRAIERADRWTFEKISGTAWSEAQLDEKLAWRDLFSTAALVNVGLSTQMIVLSATLVAGRPEWYLVWVLLCGGWALSVQLLRVTRFRRYRAQR